MSSKKLKIQFSPLLCWHSSESRGSGGWGCSLPAAGLRCRGQSVCCCFPRCRRKAAERAGLRTGSCAWCLPGDFTPPSLRNGTGATSCPTPTGMCLVSGCPARSPAPKPFSQRPTQFPPGCPRPRGGCGVQLCWGPVCYRVTNAATPPGTSPLCGPLLVAFGSVFSALLTGANQHTELTLAEMESETLILFRGEIHPLELDGRTGLLCARIILVSPFPNNSLLYEMVMSTQNHPSTSQVAKAPRKALWIGRVGRERPFGPRAPLDPRPRWRCREGTALPWLLQPSGGELTLAILSCTVSEQPSEDIDTNCGPFKSVMY